VILGDTFGDGMLQNRRRSECVACTGKLIGSRIRQDLGFIPVFPRLADAVKAGAA